METPQTYSRFDFHVDGIRNTYLSWEYNGVSHTASVENEYVGGRGLWSQTVSDIGGRGSYMPPGYKGVMPDGTTTFNRTYETIGTDPGVLRGIGDGIRAIVLTGIDEVKLLYSSKAFKVAVKGACHISIAVDLYSLTRAGINYYNTPTAENAARFKIAFLGTAANGLDLLVPGLGTVASITVFSIDAAGGFDNYYYRQDKP